MVDLIDRAKNAASSGGVPFVPGSYLPIAVVTVNPDGTPRGNSGQLRDRTFPPQSYIGELIDNLANVINGFDYDLVPAGAISPDATTDVLRIWQPYRGVQREAPLVYGTTVAGFTRSVNSANYANYWRTLGYNPQGDSSEVDTETTQLFAEDWNDDVNDVDRVPVGTWMGGDNASDVTIMDTLVQRAQGNIETYGQLVASWTIKLVPGAWYPDTAEPGDMVPLVVKSGRLDLDTEIRILAMNFGMGDDGTETVEVDVGRPTASLFDLLTRSDRDVDAVARRESIPTGLDAPVGAMYDWPGAVVPYSWQLADGGPLLRVDYPELFDVIGYAFGGAGDTFNKPDCRGRMIVGAGQGAGLTNRLRAQQGGAETVGLAIAHMPSHGHGMGNATTDHTHDVGQEIRSIALDISAIPAGVTTVALVYPSASVTGGQSQTHTHNAAVTGGGTAHENMAPFVVLNKIIRVLPPTAAAAQRRRRRSAA